MHKLVSQMVISAMRLSGRNVDARTNDADVYSLFGCLYVYGFFIDLPGRHPFTGDINGFMHKHFCLLSAERRNGSVLNVRMTTVSGENTLSQSLKRHVALDLRNAALMVGVKMELSRDTCLRMLPHVLGDSNFRDTKLLLIAATDLGITWLEKEIIAKADPNSTRPSVYVLLRKFLVQRSYMMLLRINEIIASRPYRDIHADVRAFCLEAQNNARADDILHLQRYFYVIDERNVANFMSEELLFVLKILVWNKALHIHPLVSVFADEHIRLLLRTRDSMMLRDVPLATIKKHVLEVIRTGWDKLGTLRAVDVILGMNLSLQDRKEILGAVDPKIAEFFFVQIYDPTRMRAFVNANPEYIDKASLTWVVDRQKTDTLCMFLVKMCEVGGVNVVLDEEASYKLLVLINNRDTGMLVGSGIQLAMGSRSLNYLISCAQKRALLYTVRMHIPRYDIRLVRSISEHKKWHLLRQLHDGIRDGEVLDEYVEFVGK